MNIKSLTFADVVHQSIAFDPSNESQAVVLSLIDNPWVQRLRDISQTANTRLVYMFSEHSRFGHSLGVAYLASLLIEKLSLGFADDIKPYRTAVTAAALLHDIGHLAPGSHTAYKTWFPNQEDRHEDLATRIILEDASINKLLRQFSSDLPELVCKIITEDKNIAPWAWEIISGGGWNVDRGNWCIVDSVLAGVSYGRYNIPALIESIVITKDKHLGLKENRLDAMMHFAVSRQAMYKQIYQHRVILATDCINKAIVMRARDLGKDLEFVDQHMRCILSATSPLDLSLETIFAMRESWWRYHLMQWCHSKDKIISDLSNRLINRRLFKTIRIREDESFDAIKDRTRAALRKAGFDEKYYLHEISTHDVNAGDYKQAMRVVMDDDKIKPLTEADPLFASMVKESASAKKLWLAVPYEVKPLVGRDR
jgi:uncharacterized protein